MWKIKELIPTIIEVTPINESGLKRFCLLEYKIIIPEMIKNRLLHVFDGSAIIEQSRSSQN
jgi:hypothetical protein